MFSFTEARGVMTSENESFFGSFEVGLSQNDESQTKKIIPVIEAEIVKAIIFFVAGDFFLNLSMRSNIFVEVKSYQVCKVYKVKMNLNLNQRFLF